VLEPLGVEPIGAYSPHSPSKDGRSSELPKPGAVRRFGTLRDRLVKELALAGITDIETANAFIREVYLHPRGLFARPQRPLRR
jgi:hypothetical protein